MNGGALHYDAVVVGAGTAGMVAGIRLAQAGARVCVIARGHGCTQLAPATIDEPLVPEIAGWLRDTVAAGPFPGYEYAGAAAEPMLLPTALGARKPVTLAPSTMVPGDLSGAAGGRRLALVGSPAFRDFQAGLCAANLGAGGAEARAIELDWRLDRADANAVQAARGFDDADWRAGFCTRLAAVLSAEDELIGLPAVLGLRDPGGVHAELERRLGRPVFEIPTLPPSVPGMRLWELLRAALRTAGARLVIGPQVTEVVRAADGRVLRLRTGSAGRPSTYAADAFVLATGEGSSTESEAITTGYRAVEVLG